MAMLNNQMVSIKFLGYQGGIDQDRPDLSDGSQTQQLSPRWLGVVSSESNFFFGQIPRL
jgi:hypothetical protein